MVAVVGDPDAEALISDLRARGYFVDAIVEQQSVGRLATVRLLVEEDDAPVNVDLLFASYGIESEIVAAGSRVEVSPGLEIPVAAAGHLCALKLLATNENRPQDALDLAALRQVMDAAEWTRAAEAVALIEARGYNRGRDLRSALAQLRAK